MGQLSPHVKRGIPISRKRFQADLGLPYPSDGQPLRVIEGATCGLRFASLLAIDSLLATPLLVLLPSGSRYPRAQAAPFSPVAPDLSLITLFGTKKCGKALPTPCHEGKLQRTTG